MNTRICVSGKHIKNLQDAKNELQVMLNDYEDNNGDNAAYITIRFK